MGSLSGQSIQNGIPQLSKLWNMWMDRAVASNSYLQNSRFWGSQYTNAGSFSGRPIGTQFSNESLGGGALNIRNTESLLSVVASRPDALSSPFGGGPQPTPDVSTSITHDSEGNAIEGFYTTSSGEREAANYLGNYFSYPLAVPGSFSLCSDYMDEIENNWLPLFEFLMIDNIDMRFNKSFTNFDGIDGIDPLTQSTPYGWNAGFIKGWSLGTLTGDEAFSSSPELPSFGLVHPQHLIVADSRPKKFSGVGFPGEPWYVPGGYYEHKAVMSTGAAKQEPWRIATYFDNFSPSVSFSIVQMRFDKVTFEEFGNYIGSTSNTVLLEELEVAREYPMEFSTGDISSDEYYQTDITGNLWPTVSDGNILTFTVTNADPNDSFGDDHLPWTNLQEVAPYFDAHRYWWGQGMGINKLQAWLDFTFPTY